jgi:hypothetical protein
MSLEIGDRVVRFMFDNDIKHGVIIDKYKSTPNHIGLFEYQYSVKWDDSEVIDTSYMEIGLKKEKNDSQ